jgi:hypothetical protein
MCIYGMWPWEVSKWPWFWPEVAVKTWPDLATLNCKPVLLHILDGMQNVHNIHHGDIVD